MSFKTGTVLQGGIERLTTAAGAGLIGALTLIGVLQTAAWQDIVAGILERVQAELADPARRDGWTQESIERADEINAMIDGYIADLPLALGLDPILAVGLLFVTYVLFLVAWAVVLDTFGHRRDSLSGLETERLGWKTLNLFMGSIVFAIIVFIGSLLLLLPGLILAVLLFFFPAAVVMDDENFFGAFSSSIGVVKGNALGAFAIFVVSIVTMIVLTLLGSAISGMVPPEAGVVVENLFTALGLAFTSALVVLAYVHTTGAGGQPGDDVPTDQQPEQQSDHQERPPQEEPQMDP